MTGPLVLAAAGDPPPPEAVAAAADALAAGEVVGLPTDTVYGLAADPWRPGASDRLFAVKDRPRDVVLPVLVAGAEQAAGLAAELSDLACALMGRWWPGALTLVVAARPDLGADLGGDRATIGLRCPDHPVALAVCAAAGPVALTSANRHGHPPVTTAAELAASLPGVAVVLDAGACAGEPSTVVDARGGAPQLLRAGRLAWGTVVGALPNLD